MSKDSDIAIAGRAMTQMRKERKQHRTARWFARDEANLRSYLRIAFNIGLVQHSMYHYSFIIDAVKYEYWPSNNRLRAKDWTESQFMNVDKLIPFLERQHPQS